jgi:4a-hydroxytetrahydrobiopterin dehydratase
MTAENRGPLTSQQISEALASLPGWTVVDGKLHRRYRFGSFREAFGWMTMAALAAEKADHHPDWSNSYREVTVSLWTHDAGAITAKDLDLAAVFEQLAAGAGKRA